jgi:hypothetical protein
VSIFDRARDVFEASGEIVLREDTPEERAIRRARDEFRRRLGEYPEVVEYHSYGGGGWYAYLRYQGREFVWRSGPFGLLGGQLYLQSDDDYHWEHKAIRIDSLKDLGRVLKMEEAQRNADA